MERELFAQKKALLRPLFKLTSIVGKFTKEPRNFFQAAGVITLKRNTAGGNLRMWDNLTRAKDSFPNIKMAQIFKKWSKGGSQLGSISPYIGP